MALEVAAPWIHIEAPIPGTNYVGIEVPNKNRDIIGLRSLIEGELFGRLKGKLSVAIGEDIRGQDVAADLTQLRHILITGAPHSGKSTFIHTIISCLLCTNTPDTVRFLIIDPKMIEHSIYKGVPHLLSPVIHEAEKSYGVIFWCVKEMERRLLVWNKVGARNIEEYNSQATNRNEKPMPYIVLVIDEIGDIMQVAQQEIENHLSRLGQMGHIAGIHLIISNPRIPASIISNAVKSNFPTRLSFKLTSQRDSNDIMNASGAEKLHGSGEMLFQAAGSDIIERLYGVFISETEIRRIVTYWVGIYG